MRLSVLTDCANDEEGCTMCYAYNGAMSEYADSVMCAECDEESYYFDEEVGLGCVAIPFVTCSDGWEELCDECVIYDEE